MKFLINLFHIILLLLMTSQGWSQNIFRFEHMGSENGLSQNTAFSILFDSKGFMWIGTYNGLNRYDGYEFKIYRSSSETGNSFINNRVVKLWEDIRGFIWLETYDGHYHFFNPESETFTSLPDYEESEIKNGGMHNFVQYSDDIIFLGSTVSGLFYLRYDKTINTYNIRRYSHPSGTLLAEPEVRFIHKDMEGNIWFGTSKGICLVSGTKIGDDDLVFKQEFTDMSSRAVCETTREIWFGTEDQGIIAYNKINKTYRLLNTGNTPEFQSDRISYLYYTSNGKIVAGFTGEGVMISDNTGAVWKKINFHSRNLTGVYEDRHKNIWLTAVEFGTTRVDMKSLDSKYYELTPDEIKPLTDLERPQFFEDKNDNLWIGLHGMGLARYDRSGDRFEFFQNKPGNPNSISSDFVHCIVEDKSGHLWLGTGQVIGGIEKVILKNPAFEHILPEKNSMAILDNVARAILEDNNRYLWVATKSGRLHLYDSTLKQIYVYETLPGIGQESYRNMSYSVFHDNKGFLWIGSKGYGLSVSAEPLSKQISDPGKIKFRRFEYNENDSTSLCNNNIYSICQDKTDNIWIGTYGNGLSLIREPHNKDIRFIRINQQNSNLSSNLVRHLTIDSEGNLWAATTFGLNFLAKEDIDSGNYRFKVYVRNVSRDNSLSYNDIIHIYEDSKGRLWLGTFGGGVDMLEEFDGENASFRHFIKETVPGYGIVFAILEDDFGKIWLSSENGLIRLDPVNSTTEIFNNFNGLGFNNFSENTCFKRRDGSLVFGGNMGFEVIRPERIDDTKTESRIELTKFLLFNREISTYQKDSPLKKSISFSDQIRLKHYQSSFGIDFSALDFLDPDKIEYSYRLDNFDKDWNNVRNQHRAVYTNLSPGRYVFRVKTIRQNEPATPNERVLNITITPPWWKTRIAFLIYGIIFTIITISIYKTVTRINRYKNELLIEKRVNDYKLHFFTNISHEIRSPLTLIIGPLEDILAENDLSHKKRMLMGIMLKNARRMLHLTNQLLTFRKVQNNKVVLRIRKIDIVSFTREIFKSFCPLSNHKGITFTFSSDNETLIIYADTNHLETVIYNIISNAIKFTDTGKAVAVMIENQEKSNSVGISVIDEGPGIPQKDIADIFTRYTILSNSELAGTGIGLSLSYELIKLHKGNILIDSAVGKGTTFTISLLKGNEHFVEDSDVEDDESLPAEKQFTCVDEISGNHEEEEMPLILPSDKNMILIVEDNQEILNYIIQSLKTFFTCIGAKNGNEGLHLAKTFNPDVIITDVMMPEMDGLELTRLLKEDFNTSHIPVIILTSKSHLQDQITGIETGAEAYIVKPFNMEYLKTVACNLINQRAKVASWFIEKGSYSSDMPKINSRDEQFLNNIAQFVEENLAHEVSIDNLARYCNVSRTVFYNKIKGLTGSGPLEFVRKLKLNHAVSLLRNGSNVSEAAYMTGFSDVKYFSRIFKSQFGYSPSKHRSDNQ